MLDLDGARTLEVATIRVVLLGRAEIRIVKIVTALELAFKQDHNLRVKAPMATKTYYNLISFYSMHRLVDARANVSLQLKRYLYCG